MENRAIYNIMGVDIEGKKDVLGVKITNSLSEFIKLYIQDSPILYEYE